VTKNGDSRCGAEVAGASLGCYWNFTCQKRDVWIGEPLEYAIEIKMARFVGDNGRVDDTAVKDLLSPYPGDRSAVTDCAKARRVEPSMQEGDTDLRLRGHGATARPRHRRVRDARANPGPAR